MSFCHLNLVARCAIALSIFAFYVPIEARSNPFFRLCGAAYTMYWDFRRSQADPEESGTVDLHLDPRMSKEIRELLPPEAIDPNGELSDLSKVVEKSKNQFKRLSSDPLAAGEQMARFGQQLIALLKNRNAETRREVRWMIARSVTELEAFSVAEWNTATEEDEQFTARIQHIPSVDEFAAITKAYIDRKDEIPSILRNIGGLLESRKMRTLLANNLWPLQHFRRLEHGIQNHDLRHLHHMVSNPKASSLVFSAARSHNHLRFILLSMALEGVDKNQYPIETFLLNQLQHRFGDNLEEVLLRLGSATTDQLRSFASEAYYEHLYAEGLSEERNNINAFEDAHTSWKPIYLPRRNATPVEELALQLNNWVTTTVALKSDPAWRFYLNYDQNPPRGGAPRNDQSIHLYPLR